MNQSLFETARLIARRLVPDDAADMHAIFGDPAVTRWMEDGSTLSLETCREWINVSRRNYQNPSKGYGASAVIEKRSGRLIACCGIVHRKGDDAGRDVPEIIYAIHSAYWNRGFATELVPAMLGYGLRECGLPAILATIAGENRISCEIARRAGMRLIGREIGDDGNETLVFEIRAPASGD